MWPRPYHITSSAELVCKEIWYASYVSGFIGVVTLHALLTQSLEDRQAYVKDMHLLKTELFMKLIEQGQLPLRPGVQRIISKFASPVRVTVK